MTRLLALLAMLALADGPSAGAPALGRGIADATQSSPIAIAAPVAEASARFGIPEAWIYAVIRVESAGRIGAVSSAGAMGLMQLMPGTWARQRARFGLGADPFDPRDNILAGTSYLREMLDRYGAFGALAAYNAGPGRYEDWRDRGRPLPAETRAYVGKLAQVLHLAGSAADAQHAVTHATAVRSRRLPWTQSALFAARSASGQLASGVLAKAASLQPGAPRDARLDGLFAPLTASRARR